MKRTLFCILALAVLALVLPVSAADGFIYGDADGDGAVTAGDSAEIMQKALRESYKMPIEDKTDNFLTN